MRDWLLVGQCSPVGFSREIHGMPSRLHEDRSSFRLFGGVDRSLLAYSIFRRKEEVRRRQIS